MKDFFRTGLPPSVSVSQVQLPWSDRTMASKMSISDAPLNCSTWTRPLASAMMAFFGLRHRSFTSGSDEVQPTIRDWFTKWDMVSSGESVSVGTLEELLLLEELAVDGEDDDFPLSSVWFP